MHSCLFSIAEASPVDRFIDDTVVMTTRDTAEEAIKNL